MSSSSTMLNLCILSILVTSIQSYEFEIGAARKCTASKLYLGKTDFGLKTKNWFIWAPGAQVSTLSDTAADKCLQARDAAPHLYHITKATLDIRAPVSGEAWVCSGGDIPATFIISHEIPGWYNLWEIGCTFGARTNISGTSFLFRNRMYAVDHRSRMHLYFADQKMYLPYVSVDFTSPFTDFGVQEEKRFAGRLGGGDIVVKMLAKCTDPLAASTYNSGSWEDLLGGSVVGGQVHRGFRTPVVGTLSNGSFGCCVFEHLAIECHFHESTSTQCVYLPCKTIVQQAEDLNTNFYWDIFLRIATRVFHLILHGFSSIAGLALNEYFGIPGAIPATVVAILIYSKTGSIFITALLTVAITKTMKMADVF